MDMFSLETPAISLSHWALKNEEITNGNRYLLAERSETLQELRVWVTTKWLYNPKKLDAVACSRPNGIQWVIPYGNMDVDYRAAGFWPLPKPLPMYCERYGLWSDGQFIFCVCLYVDAFIYLHHLYIPYMPFIFWYQPFICKSFQKVCLKLRYSLGSIGESSN